MRKQNVKVYRGIIALAAMSMFLTACFLVDKKIESAVNKTYGEEGKNKDITPITFDWYIDFSWFQTKWGTNPVSKYVSADRCLINEYGKHRSPHETTLKNQNYFFIF